MQIKSMLDSQYNRPSTLSHPQISALVQHRSEQPQHGPSAAAVASEKALRAIGRVGQSVNLAMERFVSVADKIGDDNPDIKQDMYEACKEARAAGELNGIGLRVKRIERLGLGGFRMTDEFCIRERISSAPREFIF